MAVLLLKEVDSLKERRFQGQAGIEAGITYREITAIWNRFMKLIFNEDILNFMIFQSYIAIIMIICDKIFHISRSHIILF